MKNILVPTDFTVDALVILKKAIEQENEAHNFILVYGKHLPGSISELMFFSKSTLLSSLESKSFTEAKGILKNRYASRIKTLRTAIFHGTNHSAFENFIKANKIDKAYIPENPKSLHPSIKKGFDLIPFIKKSGLELSLVAYNDHSQVNMDEVLAKLLVP
ncbi:hypothetical protein [Sinomicrobium soli]|uniref:hypothetical protein n=1 Tax=Sinomicrobium sp. N-1-3-6 TaxID=2219864 RepID=UPI000DCEC07F|nr:hypothetical protein [Sinomicrobium sp. N-1-3-6]RAV29915.1 hypothetical protein DN748_07415 [Sinomicrobium sp. N-1-3-6]